MESNMNGLHITQLCDAGKLYDSEHYGTSMIARVAEILSNKPALIRYGELRNGAPLFHVAAAVRERGKEQVVVETWTIYKECDHNDDGDGDDIQIRIGNGIRTINPNSGKLDTSGTCMAAQIEHGHCYEGEHSIAIELYDTLLRDLAYWHRPNRQQNYNNTQVEFFLVTKTTPSEPWVWSSYEI